MAITALNEIDTELNDSFYVVNRINDAFQFQNDSFITKFSRRERQRVILLAGDLYPLIFIGTGIFLVKLVRSKSISDERKYFSWTIFIWIFHTDGTFDQLDQ